MAPANSFAARQLDNALAGLLPGSVSSHGRLPRHGRHAAVGAQERDGTGTTS